MKKFFVAFMALATIGMISCKKENGNNNPPTPPPTPTIDVPEIAAPDGDLVTLVIHVPEGTDCNGYTFKGQNPDYEWTEMGDFEAIEGWENWYKLTLAVDPAYSYANATGLQGKVLVWENDHTTSGNWTTQWGDAANINVLDQSTATYYLGAPMDEGNKLGVTSAGILYIDIKAFASNPCAAFSTYTINAKFPEICDGSNIVPAVIGNFKGSDWGTAFDMTWNEAGACWTVEIEGQANNEFKFQAHAGSWDGQPQQYVLNAETGEYEWKDFANIVLTDETVVNLDFSNPDEYRWPECNGEKVEYNEAGEVTITITIANKEYTDGDVCVLAGNFEENAWSTEAYPMTYDKANNVWTWTGMVPAKFEFKAVYNGSWASGDNVKLLKDLSNATASFNI